MLQVGGMTSEEASASRYAHILTRSIGQQESVQVESWLFDLFPGDVCLLCSDGLSRYMESPDQVARLLRKKRLDSVPKRLIEFANSLGGADNITAVVLKVEAGPGEKCPDPEKLQHCLQVMRSVFLFEGLSLSRLTRLINIATFDDYRQGERMIEVGQDCNGI
jgi:serine/threonine protein phosphatase PrpC